MAFGPGSIAFVGFNADGNDNLAFVALEPIAAGTVITFTDKEWNGSIFNTGEATWSWTATSDVAAGAVVTMDGLAAGQTATSNLGTIAFSDAMQRDITATNETVYAYVGEASAPTFLAAIGNDAFNSTNGLLTNTGLVQGQTAISLTSLDADADIAVYAGIRGAVSFDALLPMINNPANWISQDTSARNDVDGTTPDVPFSTAPFVGEPNFQTIGFAAGSLAVSQTEGDSGETLFTFTVERSGGTTGAIDFSGSIDIVGTIRADDFAGPLTFAGTIEDGQASGTVTVRVQGDVLFERDEPFTLTLRSASNDSVGTVVGGAAVATGTIVNDDVAPLNIAFVGFNGDGADNLAFIALSDIAEGAVIHFSNAEWAGSSFNLNGVIGGAGLWSWTAGADIAAGTVITMDALATGSATSNLGTVTTTVRPDIQDNSFDVVYAYLGAPETPTSFLTAISNSSTLVLNGATLVGTGLTAGVNAIALGAPGDDLDIAYYNGPRHGFANYEDYLSHINNAANWVKQENFAVDNSVDGIFPDVPFPALPFSSDPAAQIVQFASGSLSLTQPEGTGQDTEFTFTIERTNGTAGDLAFTVRVPVAPYSDAANGTDFGGASAVITGTIPDGQSSTTVSVVVKGDTFFELNERFHLVLESASNPAASSVVIGNNFAALGTITDDDTQPTKVLAGEDHSAAIVLTGQTHFFVIEQGGSTRGITWSGSNMDIVIENGGQTASITAADGAEGAVTINNLATGIIRGVVSAEDGGRVNYTLNNAGLIELATDRMDLRDAADAGGTVVVNNLAGGVIMQTTASQDIIRPGEGAVINNYGSILHAPGAVGGSSDGIDYQGVPGVVNNYAGGLIEASRHAVTGDAPVALLNEGTMIGRNGSAINIDSNGTEAERVFITNRGRMEGRSANLADSDGDAVDIDGLLTLENYGFIGGMGHNGRHDGEPNVSEGIAVGGGTITNHAGGEIYGYGRAIQVDNSSNSTALGTTTIVNHGLIRGDGNVPTGVTPEEVEQFAERIRGGEAINLLGNFGDTLTNTATGQIIGGVKMGGGNDLLVNEGVMTATGGSAINLGDGDDTFEAHAGSSVTGMIDGGGDDDTLKLIGPGVGALGTNVNFEHLEVQSGIWTLQSDAYDSVSVATGAMVQSQLRLADQGEMTVAAGGSVLVTSGSDAVVAEGSANIENAGLIQALGMTGPTPAKAIVLNGGEVHNKAGGIILAQGTAIATGVAAVAGVDITNEGMIQSLSGQAVAFIGEQNDTVTNKGIITGSVDLGAGDDTLNAYTTSSITGAMQGGEGDDTVNLLGAGAGTLAATSGFENLNVTSGSWSIAASENYSNIEVAGGATVTSRVIVDGDDHLVVEAGGTLANGIRIADATTGAVVDNAGTITSGAGPAIGQLGELSTGDVTIINREAGVIRTNGPETISLRSEDNFPAGSKFVLDNAGLIENTSGTVIRFTDFQFDSIVIHNSETGQIIGHTSNSDVIRAAEGIHAFDDYLGNPDLVKIFNDGIIKHQPDGGAFGDTIDFGSGGGTVINSETGFIEGSRHGITGRRAVVVENDGTIVGRNGSAVNIDNDDSEEQRAFVTNHGTMQGRSANLDDSDGDAIDIDGLLTLENFGTIEGLGHNGRHSGEPNVSEGLAIGGGIITNHAGGTIYGFGRAIQVDDSENDEAFGTTTITNAGLIKGDGNLPTGVTPEEVAQFAERIRGGEAINIVGDFADTLTNNGTIIGGVKMGGGNDVLTNSGAMTATGGSAIDMGAGDDTLNVHVGSVITGDILGGDGNDTVNLLGTGTGSLGATSGFENLVVQSGAWSIANTREYDHVVVKGGATVISAATFPDSLRAISRDGADTTVIEQGGTVAGTVEIRNDQTGIALDNAGTIDKVTRGQAINLFLGEEDSTVTVWNRETGVIKATHPDGTGSAGVVYVSGDASAKLVFNNAGLIEGPERAFQANDFRGESFVLNNLAGGVIRSHGEGETLRGKITEVNNAGRIEGGSEGFDYRSNSNVTFNNLEGGYIEGLHHAVTGGRGATITNAVGGLMVGLNGSAVNVDNNGTVEQTVHVTNHGTMEGRSAETEDSDGDAIDVDGLLELDNYGTIKGLGHEGYHNGEPNVSEGIAIGGGTIRNHAGGEIYGYGRGIQVDNSSNSNALGATTIINAGLIHGDGHGPEGVAPEDAAQFDLRGNEAVNLVGTYADSLTNSGTIIGGVKMGGGNDTLTNSGTMTATGGSAIDMGDGDDTVTMLNGAVVTGAILLGDGEDRFAGADGAETVDGGAGDDLIQAGAGDDHIDGGADDDVIFGDAGNDIIIGGLGNDTIKGNADDDTFVVLSTADGRDSYDGGNGIDTLDFSALSQALNLTLRDGTTTFATDTIENIENVIGGSGADRLTGNALANVLTGNAGDDTLKGGAGNDTLDGGEGSDSLDGGADNDLLFGGLGGDVLKGAAGNDNLAGGEGDDSLDGGAGNDVLSGGAGADTLTGGAGFDKFVFNSVGDGADTITDFKVSGSSEDQLVLSASMFQNFGGDDPFDLIGSGFLRAVASGGKTQVQIDIDGGGNSFITLATLNGTISNGVLADHVVLQWDAIA